MVGLRERIHGATSPQEDATPSFLPPRVRLGVALITAFGNSSLQFYPGAAIEEVVISWPLREHENPYRYPPSHEKLMEVQKVLDNIAASSHPAPPKPEEGHKSLAYTWECQRHRD